MVSGDLHSRLGLILKGALPIEGIVFRPKLDVAWVHEFRQGRRDITASFGSGAPFTVRTMRPADGEEAACMTAWSPAGSSLRTG